MFEKRGLSAVVTTLIIILLAIVSIGVVWVVVRNVVQEGSEQIDLGAFTLDLQIKNVEVTDDDVTVTVYVKRNPGPGNFIGINFIFSDGSNSEIIRDDSALAELEERSFTFTLTEISTSNLKTISIAPIFKLSSGSESTGDVSDMFDIGRGASIATGTGSVISESSGGAFEALGFVGKGKAEYTISANSGIYPEFIKATVDPVDVKVGENQTFTAEVYSPDGIESVITRTQLDNELLILPLEETTPGVYSATWEVYDTHIEVYRTTFIARDNAGNENNMTLTWTDACTDKFVHGAAESLVDIDCTITEISGADTSDIVVDDGFTLTLDSEGIIVYTPGNSISKTGTGKILFSGGSITKSYLHYYDSDNDLSGNGTYIISTTANLSGSGFVRPIDDTGTADCNDNSSVVSTTRTQYLDNDSDGYFVVGSSFCASNSTYSDSVCSTAGSDYANSTGSCLRITTNGTADCYDANALAKPSGASYQSTDRGDGSFDYNCDNVTTKQYPTADGADVCDVGGTDECNDIGYLFSVPACGVAQNFVIPTCSGNRCVKQSITQTCR